MPSDCPVRSLLSANRKVDCSGSCIALAVGFLYIFDICFPFQANVLILLLWLDDYREYRLSFSCFCKGCLFFWWQRCNLKLCCANNKTGKVSDGLPCFWIKIYRAGMWRINFYSRFQVLKISGKVANHYFKIVKSGFSSSFWEKTCGE